MDTLGPIDGNDDIPTKKYVDDLANLKVNKAGDIMSGPLKIQNTVSATYPLEVIGAPGQSAEILRVSASDLAGLLQVFKTYIAVNTEVDANQGLYVGSWMSTSTSISINRAVGQDGNVLFQSGGKSRWSIGKNSSAEPGSNQGSLFVLARYDDAGTWLDEPLIFDRATGLGRVKADPTAPLGIATKQYVDTASGGGGVPTGTITMFGGSAAPTGWHLCDGTAHGSTALEAVIGSTTTPDLRDRFIVGAGSAYALKATGGEATHLLTAAESGLPGHAHTASASGDVGDHQHLIDPPATNSGYISHDHAHSFGTGYMNQSNPHAHDDATDEGITTGDSDNWVDSADDDTAGPLRWNIVRPSNADINHTHSGSTSGVNTNHYHATDIAAFWSGGISAAHSHTITVNAVAAANASAAHENRPPYYALTYIIKK